MPLNKRVERTCEAVHGGMRCQCGVALVFSNNLTAPTLGQELTFCTVGRMPALPLKTDMGCVTRF